MVSTFAPVPTPEDFAVLAVNASENAVLSIGTKIAITLGAIGGFVLAGGVGLVGYKLYSRQKATSGMQEMVDDEGMQNYLKPMY